MKIDKKELHRLITEEIRKHTTKKSRLDEGMMVPLQPIAVSQEADKSEKSRWMRIAGIVERNTLRESEEEIVDLKPYGEWIEDLMNILRVDDPDQIPDITSYDAYNNGVSAKGYADLIGEPEMQEEFEEEVVTSPVSGDSEEDWIYDLEGEMEAKMQGMESGEVVDFTAYKEED
jgi:hypothetical protein